MNSLPAELYGRLHSTLLRCAPFDSNAGLAPIFVDARLSPWRHALPQADSPAARANAVIAYLIEQESVAGVNALILLVKVLAERAPEGTACRQQLATLVEQVAAALATPAADTVPSGPAGPDRSQLLQALTEYLDEEDLRTLCFDLDVDYEMLAGSHKGAKARQLILHMDKFRRRPDLAAALKRMRPGLSWE